MEQMVNFTCNMTTDHSEAEEAPLVYRQVFGTIIFIAVWPLIVFDFSKYFPISRPAAALVGGTLMVMFYVLDQLDVYKILGGEDSDRGNLRTLFLLMGMMLLSFYFDREGLLQYVALKVFGKSGAPFRSVLWRVCLVSGFLSALITNDAACVIITPLLLEEHFKQKRDKKELYFLCLAIATSANIGSAATFFGNPQNAFIASVAGVGLLQFLISLLPASIIGLLINIGLLYLYYFIELKFGDKLVCKHWPGRREEDQDPEQMEHTSPPQDENNNHEGEEGHNPPPPRSLAAEREATARVKDPYDGQNRHSLIALERDTLLGSMTMISGTWAQRTSVTQKNPDPKRLSDSTTTSKDLSKSLPALDQPSSYGATKYEETSFQAPPLVVITNENAGTPNIGEDTPVVQDKKKKVKKWKKIAFIVSIIVVTALVMVLLVIPKITLQDGYELKFDLGLVPFGGAVIIMLIDCIINRISAYDAMVQIDWTLILLFIGLFIWLEGFQQTGFPTVVFDALKDFMSVTTVQGIIFFTVFVLIGSNIISNVPLTILIVHQICGLYKGCHEDASRVVPAMLLAWVATVAGNFTLIGSIANLLVAEKAKTSKHKYILGFFPYLMFGSVSTLLVTFSCLPIVYGMSVLSELIPI